MIVGPYEPLVFFIALNSVGDSLVIICDESPSKHQARRAEYM
jgi:hypothetical protein